MRSKCSYIQLVCSLQCSKCDLIGEKQEFFVKSGIHYFIKLINSGQSVHDKTLHT